MPWQQKVGFMKKSEKKSTNHSLYSDISLFFDVKEENYSNVLECLCGMEKEYAKGAHIVHIGDRVSSLQILLSGRAYLYNVDSSGERTILFEMKRGDLIGGSLIFSKDDIAPYGVLCIEKTKVLMINPGELISKGSPVCPFKSLIMKNLLYMISEENALLRNKLYMASIKSLREKIYSYLYLQASILKAGSFTIPFVNRSDFADYLNVNSSALSRELSRMKHEGILDFYKNSFTLKRYP